MHYGQFDQLIVVAEYFPVCRQINYIKYQVSPLYLPFKSFKISKLKIAQHWTGTHDPSVVRMTQLVKDVFFNITI